MNIKYIYLIFTICISQLSAANYYDDRNIERDTDVKVSTTYSEFTTTPSKAKKLNFKSNVYKFWRAASLDGRGSNKCLYSMYHKGRKSHYVSTGGYLWRTYNHYHLTCGHRFSRHYDVWIDSNCTIHTNQYGRNKRSRKKPIYTFDNTTPPLRTYAYNRDPDGVRILFSTINTPNFRGGGVCHKNKVYNQTSWVYNRQQVKASLFCNNKSTFFSIMEKKGKNNKFSKVRRKNLKYFFYNVNDFMDKKWLKTKHQTLKANELNKLVCYKKLCPKGLTRRGDDCKLNIIRPTIKKFPKILYIPYNANDLIDEFNVPNLNNYFTAGNGTLLKYKVEAVSSGLDVVIVQNKLVISSINNTRLTNYFKSGIGKSNEKFTLIVKQPIKHLPGEYLVLKFKINVVLMNSVYNPSEQKLYECQALSDN